MLKKRAPAIKVSDLTRLDNVAIHETPEVAADKEAFSLSRVYYTILRICRP